MLFERAHNGPAATLKKDLDGGSSAQEPSIFVRII